MSTGMAQQFRNDVDADVCGSEDDASESPPLATRM
jgi:hypothetical protein